MAVSPATAVNVTFAKGKKYLARHNKSFKITIVKRTAKTITFISEVDGKASPFGVETKKVRTLNGSEYFVDGIFIYYADQTK